MSDELSSGAAIQQRPLAKSTTAQFDDLNGSGMTAAPARRPTATTPARPLTGRFMTGEVAGDAVLPPPPRIGESTGSGAHAEVGTEAAESGEEFIEATPQQLAAATAEAGEESALSDLSGIEGFEMPEAGESAPVVLAEAGTAAQGGQAEFLPILGALVPTLLSTIGPAVAKGVMSRLSPRATRAVARIRKLPSVPAVAGAAAKIIQGSGGPSSLLALLARLLEQNRNKPGGESGEEVDEAFLAEAVAAMEVIIGTDDRVRVTATTQIPWRRICALRIHFPSGAVFRGTGFFISPRALATAGHCVFMHAQGGWARKIEVIPGANGTSQPFGKVEATAFRSVTGWVNDKLPESDYGCIMLPSASFNGKNLGSFGFAAFDAPTLLAQPAVVAGYPGDKPFAELWGMAQVIKAVGAKTLVYNIDTVGGQSGAPVYIKRNGQRFVVGIHNYGAGSGNSATRITQPVYQRLLGWSQL